MAVADAEGVDALTMRRLAAELGSSPMSLYRHLPGGKDDLIDLMLDAVLGEHDLSGLPSGDPAADLSRLAQERRAAALRHPWSITPPARPTLGPHGMRRLDTALSVFGTDNTLTPEYRGWAIGVVDAYVIGAVSQELAEHNEQLRTGLDDEQWQHAVAPYVSRVLKAGNYPHLAAYITEAPRRDIDADFRRGVDAVVQSVLQGQAIQPDRP
ncbi:TetR/AcrR family transcriptional regulator C-terminal domain-containing protein [Microbacterium sp. YMB-B2]|uniref:TetR/AcrR family transcriptional regulator C-terminal domain-containing protein n=2 Tax=Microbacterium tenebrionis TaxID=2830665 RepID=A0A9X1LM36_9MICO|nr:TetR/AcrR family transcriptional regulator C-terminal domain-containing protein [Microbacterium tenebrionis]